MVKPPREIMKIGLVCPYNIGVGGGVQECVLALREEIARQGHKALIITPQPRGQTNSAKEGIIMVGGATKVRGFHTSAQVSASVDTDRLDALLRAEDFDIIHFHEPWIPILSRQILSRSQAINIGTFHARLPDRMLSKTIEKVITPYTKSILKYLDVLTAVSKPATVYVNTLTNRKVHIVANGIDLNKYTLGARKNNKRIKTVFFIGRLEKRKGLKYLLDAFAVLNSKSSDHYQLIIAGDGPERKRLEEYALENKIPGVKFVGFISEAEKLRRFHEADIFCSPAMYGESFGIVLLEAMASGCVAVAGNNPGYESVMKGAGQISIVNPKDKFEFARRLAMLSTDKQLRDMWRKWATGEVKQYSYKGIASEYIKLYEAAYARKYA